MNGGQEAGGAKEPRSGGRRESLGDILVRRGLVSSEDLEASIREQRSSGRRLGDVLVDHELVSTDDLVEALGEQLGVPCLRDADLIQPQSAALELLPRNLAMKYCVLPLSVDERSLEIAMADPLDLVARDDIAKITEKRLQPVICSEATLRAAIDASYLGKGSLGSEDDGELESSDGGSEVNLDDLRELINDAPIIKLVNSLIVKAIRDGASDIHIEPQKKRLKIRYRIDGILYPLATVSRDLSPVVVSRIKIMSEMDIAERRLPQDGRISVVFDKKDIDLRVSTLPGIFGEKVVMRLLIKDAIQYDFNALGYTPENQEMLRRHVHSAQGLVLLTGPTGSGKTTTLYTCLAEVDRERLNVVTLEDPVEYQLAGIHQVHIQAKIGLTFAAGLRTILRQDPDVVMVGEMRDRETAEQGIRAALTGHLVFSTLHTNDAIGTLTRLINMEIEPFLVTEAVSLAGAQRLLRANCPDCLESYEPDPVMLERLGIPPGKHEFRRGAGCTNCRNIGYRGRVAVVEFAEMTGTLRDRVLAGDPPTALRKIAADGGMKSIREDGVSKALAGETTLDEVLRVCVEH